MEELLKIADRLPTVILEDVHRYILYIGDFHPIFGGLKCITQTKSKKGILKQ